MSPPSATSCHSVLEVGQLGLLRWRQYVPDDWSEYITAHSDRFRNDKVNKPLTHLTLRSQSCIANGLQIIEMFKKLN